MMHSVKIIILDLDGTLLRTDKTISERTKNVLRRCREAGIKVAYATGRGGSAEKVAPSELFDGKITMNGAVAKVDDRVIYERLIPMEVAKPILMACDRRGLNITSEMSGMHYTNYMIPEEWADVVTNYEMVDFSKHNKDAEKIYTYNLTPEDITFIEKLLPDDLYMVMAIDGLSMIMHKDATKSKAVSELVQLWSIEKSEIVAFGDDLNDIDLLSYVGVGVAMENALDKVKSVSNYVCGSNDEDGLAEWILQNVLGR